MYLAVPDKPHNTMRVAVVFVYARTCCSSGEAGEVVDQFVEVATSERAVYRRAVEDVDPVDPAKMRENVSIGPAEHEPRIAFITGTTVYFADNPCCIQQPLHAEKIGQFLVAPVFPCRLKGLRLGVRSVCWKPTGVEVELPVGRHREEKNTIIV